jgi:ribonuclease J
VLDKLKELSPKLPPHQNDHIRIYYIRKHAQDIVDCLGKDLLYKYKSRKIEIEEIVKSRSEMVLKLPVSAMGRIINELTAHQALDNAKFIYSMWPGYLERDSYYYDFCDKHNTELLKVHVSGHAYFEDLKKLAEALNPGILVPVHTLCGDDFTKHFNNVVRVDDGSELSI